MKVKKLHVKLFTALFYRAVQGWHSLVFPSLGGTGRPM
jgi:hypothetical protein